MEDVPVDEDLFAYYDDDGYPSDEKGTFQDHQLHPKLVHLVISVVFMMATFTSVSQLINIICTKVQLTSANWGTYHLHGKTGNSSWKIKWFAPFRLGSFRKFGL